MTQLSSNPTPDSSEGPSDEDLFLTGDFSPKDYTQLDGDECSPEEEAADQAYLEAVIFVVNQKRGNVGYEDDLKSSESIQKFLKLARRNSLSVEVAAHEAVWQIAAAKAGTTPGAMRVGIEMGGSDNGWKDVVRALTHAGMAVRFALNPKNFRKDNEPGAN